MLKSEHDIDAERLGAADPSGGSTEFLKAHGPLIGEATMDYHAAQAAVCRQVLETDPLYIVMISTTETPFGAIVRLLDPDWPIDEVNQKFIEQFGVGFIGLAELQAVRVFGAIALILRDQGGLRRESQPNG